MLTAEMQILALIREQTKTQKKTDKDDSKDHRVELMMAKKQK